MKKIKLFFLSFGIAFTSISLLCILFDYPLIFYPTDYSFGGFFRLAILVVFLSFGLVYINFSFLKWLATNIKLKTNFHIYYVGMSLLVLQVFTMLTGYFESHVTQEIPANFCYYYGCVSNSCLYLFAGNLTTVIIAYLFGKEENKTTLI